MKLKPGMTVTVKLNDEELRFLIVRTGGDGKERLSLKAAMAVLLGGMAIGNWLWWRVEDSDGELLELLRVELIAVEEATDE